MDTLFGNSADLAKPRTPPPEWVVKELKLNGVSDETIATYGSRQAFAVLKKLQDQQQKDSSPARAREERGGSLPERAVNASGLEDMLANEMGDPYERLCNRLLYSLYPLKRSEFVQVVRYVIQLLKGKDDQRLFSQLGKTDEGQAEAVFPHEELDDLR